jgi:hypothetical protein
MTYALVFWTVVGLAGDRFSTDAKYDWRVLLETSSSTKCEEAARLLNIKPTLYRCIPK